MSNSNPSVNPADLDSITGAFRLIFTKLMQNTDGLLPARVVAFDRKDPNRVQIQFLIMMIDTQGQPMSLGQIASVPVLQLGGGGFVASFNLKPGDLGWVLAADRDLSLFLQSYDESPPNTFRQQSFSDSWFIPDVMHGYTVAEEDLNNFVIQSKNGTVKISFGTDKIKISAPTIELVSTTELTIDCPNVTVVAPEINITASGTFDITAPVLAVTGNITATGSITPNV